MTREYVFSAVGRNITGTVAKVSRAIYECGCNFEDSRMTLLGNHFALMILVTAADDEMGRELALRCDKLQQETDLAITLFPVDKNIPEGKKTPTEPNYELRVKGVDRMGIVYRTTQLLAELNINIVEMKTRVVPGKNGEPVFSMRMGVAVPRNVDGETLRNELKYLAEDNREMISLTRI